MAEKTEHVHSADEDKDAHPHDHAAPMPEASPSPKKPDEHSEHQHSTSDEKKTAETPMPDHQHGAAAAQRSKHSEHAMMRSSINVADPMSREGSGTSWLPDSSPLYAYMKMYEDGSMLMLHGAMFLRYTSIGSSRDVSIAGKGSRNRFDAPSMFMAMYSKPIGDDPRSDFARC
jgi:hypothetical protein